MHYPTDFCGITDQACWTRSKRDNSWAINLRCVTDDFGNLIPIWE